MPTGPLFQSVLASKDERYGPELIHNAMRQAFQSALAPKDEKYEAGPGRLCTLINGHSFTCC